MGYERARSFVRSLWDERRAAAAYVMSAIDNANEPPRPQAVRAGALLPRILFHFLFCPPPPLNRYAMIPQSPSAAEDEDKSSRLSWKNAHSTLCNALQSGRVRELFIVRRADRRRRRQL